MLGLGALGFFGFATFFSGGVFILTQTAMPVTSDSIPYSLAVHSSHTTLGLAPPRSAITGHPLHW